ncbi:MAG: hypothetical protein ACLR40_01300 [Oscillospiraceae bacterium]
MYQGKFDSKNKKTAVDVSQLVAQRNSAPSQEQPQRQPVRENPPKTNPARAQQPPRQQNVRQSQPTRQPSGKRPPVTQTVPEKHRKGPRLGGVIFYTLYFMFILVFFVATFFGLQWLQGWLADYQAAQPTTKSQEVFDQLFSHPDWGALYDAAGIEDTPYEGKEQFVSYMENKVGDATLTFKETSAGLSGDKKYFVLLGDEKIASFTLSGQTAAITDIPDWELGSVELFFDRSETFYIQNVDGHTVEVNGVPLDDSHVIQIATTAAAERLPIGVTGTSTCTQEISDLMAVPTVTIFDKSGKSMEVSYDAETHTFTEQTEANTISDSEREAALNAAKTNCLFMIEKASKADIAKYFDTSSDVYSVIVNLGNLWVQDNNGYRFTKEEVSDYARYSDDLFSAHVVLNLNVTRKDGTTKDFGYDQTLFFRKQDTGKWLVYDATNADVNAPVGKVRLTFMNGDTVLSSEFVKTDATELDTPLVSAPEGKVFIGWYRIDKYDNGTTYTMAFDPDENGHVTIPNGTTLEPMTLYALFETPSGTDATEGG